jgi:hypothetical protein
MKREELLALITGGRPMSLIGEAFRDVVSGRMVYYYRDLFGRGWMAENRWAKFRVSCPLAEQTEHKENSDEA